MPHHAKSSLSKLTLVFIIVGIYLIWMDVALYINLQQLPPLNQRNIKRAEGTPFSPFEPITMKLLMMPPFMHYIDLPLAQWLEDSLKISSFFTANTVSFVGLGFGLLAARLFMCQNYKWRVLGKSYWIAD